jgi:hypothetical protein
LQALTGLFGFAWFASTLILALTFVRTSRLAIARGILAPYHIPLRHARWTLGASSAIFFIAGLIIALPEKQSTPPVSSTIVASPAVAETPSLAMATPVPAAEIPKSAAEDSSQLASFTGEQIESARHIFCRTEQNLLGQMMANAIGDRPQMDATTMPVTTIEKSAEKAKTELGLSETDAMLLIDRMLKEYPDIGASTSMAEVVKACQGYGELSD